MKRYFAFLFIIPVIVAMQCGGKSSVTFGTVAFVMGTVERYNADDETWQPVTADKKVMLGDSLRTGKESRAEIVFGNDSRLSVGEETKIFVTEKLIDDEKTLLVNNCFGTVVSDIKKLTQGRKGYRVVTPTSVAAVRGTYFSVSFSLHTREADVTVLAGKVWVGSPFVTESVLVLPGFFTVVGFKRAPFVPQHFNYGHWKKFAPLLPPGHRKKFQEKYRIKTPLLKKMFSDNPGKGSVKPGKGDKMKSGKVNSGNKGFSGLKSVFKKNDGNNKGGGLLKSGKKGSSGKGEDKGKGGKGKGRK